MSKLTKKVALVTAVREVLEQRSRNAWPRMERPSPITYAKDAKAASAVVKAIEGHGGKALAIQADAADVKLSGAP